MFNVKCNFFASETFSFFHSLPSVAVQNVFIVAAKRTAFGTYGGKLKNLTCTDLTEIAAKAALESANVKPEAVTSVIVGNVIQVRAFFFFFFFFFC